MLGFRNLREGVLKMKNMDLLFVFLLAFASFFVGCSERKPDKEKTMCLFLPVALIDPVTPKFFTQDKVMTKRQTNKVIKVLNSQGIHFENTDQGLFLDCTIVQDKNKMHNISEHAGLVPNYVDLYFAKD